MKKFFDEQFKNVEIVVHKNLDRDNMVIAFKKGEQQVRYFTTLLNEYNSMISPVREWCEKNNIDISSAYLIAISPELRKGKRI